MTAPLGVILAGGKATRMGGGDKGLRHIGGMCMMDHVIARLAPQCAGIAINANGDPARFAAFGLPIIPDSLPNHPGPLAGVLAGLDWAADQGAEAIVTAAADTPFFPRDLATCLKAKAGPSGLAIAATVANGKLWHQPTFGLWPTTLREDLRTSLQDGLRKIVLWTDKHQAGVAEFSTDPIDPFFNVNTPEDLSQAEIMLNQM